MKGIKLDNKEEAQESWIRRNPKKTVFLLLFFLSFVLLEAGLRMSSPMPAFGPYFDLRPHAKFKLYPDLKGVSSPAWHTANKWGMRGDEPPVNWEEYFTILTIGGSTTQCFYLDDQKTWPYLLQEKLKTRYPKIWVGNAGLDGHSTWGHLLMMDKVVKKVKPKAIIFLLGANDLVLSLWEKIRGNKYDNWFEAKVFLLEHSRLFQLVYLWKRILVDDVTVVKKIGHGDYIPQKMEGNETLLPDLKEMLPSLPNFRKNVISIINKAKKLNIRVIFLTQPSLYEDNKYWASIVAHSYWVKKRKHLISAATEWRLLEVFNHELLQICEEQGVECFDLASKIPHSFDYFYDLYHFNEKGTDLVASEVATYITRIIHKNGY